MATLNATANLSVTAAPEKAKGFDAPCLFCGESGSVSVSLDNLSEFNCGNCDTSLTLDEIGDRLAVWAKVVRWARAGLDIAAGIPDGSSDNQPF